MSKGIYLFWDNKYEQVIYAGRFTGRKRIKEHFYPSNKHVQKINEYIQEHKDRIEPVIFCEFDDISDDDLNQLEIETIKLFKLNKYKYPDSFVFNFNDGGDGNSGYITSEKTKNKLSESLIGREVSNKTRKKISESKKGDKNPMKNPKTAKKVSKTLTGRKLPEETIEKISISHLKDYPRIIRSGKIKGKQRYSIKYQGEVHSSSTDKKRLFKKWYSEYPDIELVDETI